MPANVDVGLLYELALVTPFAAACYIRPACTCALNEYVVSTITLSTEPFSSFFTVLHDGEAIPAVVSHHVAPKTTGAALAGVQPNVIEGRSNVCVSIGVYNTGDALQQLCDRPQTAGIPVVSTKHIKPPARLQDKNKHFVFWFSFGWATGQ